MYSHRRVAGLGAHTRLLPHQRKIIMERADKVAATLKDALVISNGAEKRINDRVTLIDNRFNTECAI